jgi:ribosomal protein S18 acetylase RimI-like enzyme
MGQAGTESSDCGARPFNKLAVRDGTNEDVTAVAAMHRLQIAEGFLPTLGARFLKRLYRQIVRSPHGFLVVARDDADAVIGFVAGTTDTRRLYRQFVVREGAIVTVTSGVRIARSLPQVLETLRYGSGDGSSPEPELLALAVDDAWRRRGVGTTLVNAFLQRATASGATTARVVVGAGNTAAVELYRRAGFGSQTDVEVHRGRASLVMRTDLSGHGSR